MKREILFRGARVCDGHFVNGSLVEVNGECDSNESVPHIVISYGPDTFDWFEVDPETVGQFTGMTDKNGKRIFEGDRGIHKIFGEVYVKYLIQECAFVYVSKDSDHRMGHRNTGSGYTCDVNFEVLGTIYDNKELLK